MGRKGASHFNALVWNSKEGSGSEHGKDKGDNICMALRTTGQGGRAAGDASTRLTSYGRREGDEGVSTHTNISRGPREGRRRPRKKTEEWRSYRGRLSWLSGDQRGIVGLIVIVIQLRLW